MIIKTKDLLKTQDLEVLTLDELKTFCRISHTFEDESIKEFRETSVDLLERTYEISIYKKRLVAIYKAPKIISDNMNITNYTKDPDDILNGICLKYGPVVSVENIKLIKFNYEEVDFTDYSFLEDMSKIRYSKGSDVFNQEVEYIKVTYLTGFDEDKIPTEIKSAIRYLVLNLYEKDETFNPITSKVGDLMAKYKDNAWYL